MVQNIYFLRSRTNFLTLQFAELVSKIMTDMKHAKIALQQQKTSIQVKA